MRPEVILLNFIYGTYVNAVFTGEWRGRVYEKISTLVKLGVAGGCPKSIFAGLSTETTLRIYARASPKSFFKDL